MHMQLYSPSSTTSILVGGCWRPAVRPFVLWDGVGGCLWDFHRRMRMN